MNRVKVEIDFHELREYVETQRILTFEMVGLLKIVILQVANEIVSKTKLDTPVDTGALKNSWGIRTEKISQRKVRMWSNYADDWVDKILYTYKGNTVFKGRGSGSIDSLYSGGKSIGVVIMNPQDYASEIEEGFITNAGTWYEGRYMLKKSIDSVIPRVQSYYDTNFEKFKKEQNL